MKTYEVLREGWLTNGRGHGAHYVPAAKGKKPVTITMTEEQARYLVEGGQLGVLDDAPGTGEVAQVARAVDLPHVQTPDNVETKVAPKGTTKARQIS